MYHYKDAGLKNVWLVNGYSVRKTAYGQGVVIEDVTGLTRTICKALVRKPGRLSGAEFRYLRLHLDMSQKALAKFFGNTEQSVANWEKSGRVPLWADRGIRLVWEGNEEGSQAIKTVMDRLRTIDRILSSKIVIRETRAGWRSEIESPKASAIAKRQRLAA